MVGVVAWGVVVVRCGVAWGVAWGVVVGGRVLVEGGIFKEETLYCK